MPIWGFHFAFSLLQIASTRTELTAMQPTLRSLKRIPLRDQYGLDIHESMSDSILET